MGALRHASGARGKLFSHALATVCGGAAVWAFFALWGHHSHDLAERVERLERTQSLNATTARDRATVSHLNAARIEPSVATPSSASERNADAPALARAEARLARETRDEPWATNNEQSLRALFKKPEFSGSQLRSVRCLATACRIELTHASERAKEIFFFNGLRQPPLAGATIFCYPRDAAELDVLLYVARPGHALPTSADRTVPAPPQLDD